MIIPLVDTIHALARLLEEESAALVARAAPDAFGTLAAARARLLTDLDRLGAATADAALRGAAATLRDAVTVHTAVIRQLLHHKNIAGLTQSG